MTERRLYCGEKKKIKQWQKKKPYLNACETPHEKIQHVKPCDLETAQTLRCTFTSERHRKNITHLQPKKKKKKGRCLFMRNVSAEFITSRLHNVCCLHPCDVCKLMTFSAHTLQIRCTHAHLDVPFITVS